RKSYIKDRYQDAILEECCRDAGFPFTKKNNRIDSPQNFQKTFDINRKRSFTYDSNSKDSPRKETKFSITEDYKDRLEKEEVDRISEVLLKSKREGAKEISDNLDTIFL